MELLTYSGRLEPLEWTKQYVFQQSLEDKKAETYSAFHLNLIYYLNKKSMENIK